MKICTRCGRELLTTLDEYGPDLHAPLCVTCWLEDERKDERAHEALEEAEELREIRVWRMQQELGL